MRATLVLEDGRTFPGERFGAADAAAGEVVFNTAMGGYHEVLTDPSYAGQIVVMTHPLMGNYGVLDGEEESGRVQVAGFVVREACDAPSPARLGETLAAYLARHGVAGLAGVDTRALTRHLRERGTLRGVIVDGVPEGAALEMAAARARAVDLTGVVDRVTTPRPYRLPGRGPRVAVLDFGAKAGILRALQALDCDVSVLPAGSSPDEVLALRPDGVLLSNGPGDPAERTRDVATIRALLGQVPLFGICFGNQLLALAAGARTYKLKYGHRGSNHPVREVATGRVRITTQNHGYAVDPDSLAGLGVEVTEWNLNDGTVEGIRLAGVPAWAVQYHPEAGPGPVDSLDLFTRFVEYIAGDGRAFARAAGA